MKRYEINSSFKRNYIRVGTHGNLVFNNCPDEILDYIEESYLKAQREYKTGERPCIVVIDKRVETALEHTLYVLTQNNSNYSLKQQIKKELPQFFFNCLYLLEIMKMFNIKTTRQGLSAEHIERILKDFKESNAEDVKKAFLKQSQQIKVLIDKFTVGIHTVELEVILRNNSSESLQKAINEYIWFKQPYSIKIFTNKETLPTYSAQNGRIEPPNDFKSLDIHSFLHLKETDKEKN